jgi:hypothetical protein
MIQVFEHSDHIINNLPHWVTAKSPIRTKAFENRQHLDTTAAGVSVSCQSIMLPLDDCERGEERRWNTVYMRSVQSICHCWISKSLNQLSPIQSRIPIGILNSQLKGVALNSSINFFPFNFCSANHPIGFPFLSSKVVIPPSKSAII